MERYPNDCSAECDKRAKWQFDYKELYSPPNHMSTMRACDTHRDEIRKAADISAVGAFPTETELKI